MSEYKLDNTDISKKDIEELEKGHNAKLGKTPSDVDFGDDEGKKKSTTSKRTKKDDDVNEVAEGGEGEQAHILFQIKSRLAIGKKVREDFLKDATDLISGVSKLHLSDKEKIAIKKFIEKNLLDKLSNQKTLK